MQIKHHIVDMTGGVLELKRFGKEGNYIIVVHNKSIHYTCILLETLNYPRAVQVYQRLVKTFDKLNQEEYATR